MAKRLLGAALLTLILIFGAALRFVGKNWDDFAMIHPDERFLTTLLLPQIGGNNAFTGDQIHFPDQQLLALAERNDILSFEGLRERADARIGAVGGSYAVDVLSWLDLPAERGKIYSEYWAAEEALLQGQVDALIVDKYLSPSDANLIVNRELIGSIYLQRLRCQHFYPNTDGRGAYFDARCSPLNPHNAGHGFYVYGSLPLFLAHFGSEILRSLTDAGFPLADYQTGTLVWRGISMLFDILAIFAVFGLGRRLQNDWVGLLAAFFYAAAPLAIQKAHFGTANAVTSCLVIVALYYAVGAQQRGRLGSYLMFGLACGAAVASRINTAPLAAVILLAACAQAMPAFDSRLTRDARLQLFARQFFALIVAGLGAFLAFRILNPYAFTGPGFFGLSLNSRWLANLLEQASSSSNLSDVPPSWQWLARSPWIYTFKDMLFWGMGLGFGVLAWFGWCWSAYRLARVRKGATNALILLVWVGGYYLWMSRLIAFNARYYLPLYGALAVFAGWCLYELYQQAKNKERSLPITGILLLLFGALLFGIGLYQVANGISDATALSALAVGALLLASALIPRFNRQRPLILGGFAVGFSLLWALMFANVYRHQTALVQASRYISESVPGDFALKIEEADESTPLINIAFWNLGLNTFGLDGSPYTGATPYQEARPMRFDFRAPASGTVSSVFAPHLGDPLDDPQPEEINIRIYESGAASPAASATLVANLSRAQHPLGAAYTIPLEPPLTVQAGQQYTFVVETAPGSDAVFSSGSVVLIEGAWDERATGVNLCRLPEGITLADDPPPGFLHARDCNGWQVWQALINSQDQIMSFPVDNHVKYDDILRTLDIGDYLSIATNRFYDSEPRNLLRWPLTTLYYEKLFAEELGYELVGIFHESFEFGPWRVSDQHLPTYASPAWLNELEADESFHVYDHPAVYLFRKTENYSRARVEALFAEVSLAQAHELQDDGAQLLGVINWNTAQANPVPTGLTLPPADYETQTQGGTWSERFFSDALINNNQGIGVFLWYLTIWFFGALAFPLVFGLMPKLADGGYGVSKLIGMLLVAWLAWAVSALKIPLWSQAGILLCLGTLALLSAAIGYRNRSQLLAFLREHWRRLAWLEVIAFVAFLFLIFVRLTNPDLWHFARGGEKPMNFAYLNGILRSTTFPPIDPWFAGGFINYYYFGYVLLGAPTLLLGVVPAFAYNLMIPTLFSLTGLGAFSTAFNILSRWRKSESEGESESETANTARPARRLGRPWVAGLMALLLCVLLGNLDTVRVFGNGLALLGGYRQPEGLSHFLLAEYAAENGIENPLAVSLEMQAELKQQADALYLGDSLRYEIDNSVSLIRGISNGIGRLLEGQPLNTIGSDRWFWGPSRVLAETPGVRGNAITEMPYFTFVYGDLHAHMISMPLILLTVLLLFNELAQVGRERRGQLERFLTLALLALAVGVLQATNTWDWPTMTLLAVVGLVYIWCLRWHQTFRQWQDARFYIGGGGVLGLAAGAVAILRSSFPAAGFLANILTILLGLLLAGSALMLLRFLLSSILLRASALDLLARVGGFLLLNLAFALPYTSWHATTYNSARLWDGGKTPLWAYFDIHGLFLFLIASLLLWDTYHWLRDTQVKTLLQHRQLLKAIAVAAVIMGLLALALTLMGYQVALIVLPLVGWIALLFFRPRQAQAMRFILALIGLALSLTLGVEIIVIGGDIGRQNTVFKFYMQVWLLFSVAGGLAFACLLTASERFSRRLKVLWYSTCGALVFIAALFPLMATRGRSFDRMAPDLPLTLNGIEYMTQARHFESSPEFGRGDWLELAVDHALIRWLQENVDGSPVIIEGRRHPNDWNEYNWNGRIAINTGLPSVLGWKFHQQQQRTFAPLPQWILQRQQNITHFYQSADIDSAVDMIQHFDIQYIIKSGLEEIHASPAGLEKFERMVADGLLSVAYEFLNGKIYQVNQEALMQYQIERHQ